MEYKQNLVYLKVIAFPKVAFVTERLQIVDIRIPTFGNGLYVIHMKFHFVFFG